MIIDPSNNLKSSNTLTGRTSQDVSIGNNASKDSAPTSEGRNNVVLSSEAQDLSRLQERISSAPEVNTERIAEIKQAITEGRFSINPERLAEAMLKYDDLLASR